MKKIPRADFEKLTKLQQDMIASLGIEIEEPFKTERRNNRITDSVLEKYACVVETECKLCKTTVITVFAMEGTGGLLVSHESSIDQVEGMTIKTRSETVLTCPSCHDNLKLMSQEDLIALTLKAAKGEVRCRRER
jgi:predicted HNH restriction endonuclease